MAAEFAWDNPNRVVAEVTRMLRDRGVRIQRVPDRAIRRATFELVAIIKGQVPKVTVALTRSVTGVVRRLAADLLEGRVGSYLKYARYLEEGTGIYGPRHKPIIITAKRGKALYWGASDSDGNGIFRKRVSIKGIKPRQYFGKAVVAFLPRFVEIIQQELAREAA